MKSVRLLIVGSVAFILVSCGGAKKPDPGEVSRLYGARGLIQFTGGNLPGALAEYRKAYTAAAQADLPLQEAQCLFNIGRVYYELGFLDSAETAFLEAYGDFTFYKDKDRAATAAGFIALVNAQGNRFDSAFAWYGRGRPGDLSGNAETAFWLTVQAHLCIMKDRMPEAQGYLDRAMECYKSEKMYSSMAQVDYYRAIIAFSSAKYDDARASLAASLASLDKAPERFRRWRVLLAYATASFCLRDEESGVRYYTRAMDCVPRGVAVPPPIDSVRTCPAKWWEHYR
jgi:tetratricopeptide (TPR) repeat protein